ncbi:NADH-quinone oxidoreductase subunit NuoE [Biformimicrobium ophioploci]|uniref:NADH-quinone oxidoreductase subunit E n=1 Tax=Biformimicrobium ophioploci TaxID=3036711 RepID=A0ABQ6LX78_9GAMM|nr:NADH-quinone oxidoreductase subunit NuoE [Microbulbifer sp. NKW57]GMG86685.1 NADH-quinone oxidoreductase subunit NuoE [Microbulbifer sp. NKW57]
MARTIEKAVTVEPEIIAREKVPGPYANYLTAQEKAEIDHEIPRYETKRAVGIDALKIVQKYRGWISDDTLKAVAEYLSLSVAELEGVATFYTLIFREPVGRQVIYYCDSVSCWIMGGEQVRAKLEEHLGIKPGETTADGEYTLIPIQCLGDCDKAPVMMVGEQMHRHLSCEKIREIFAGENA